jgi:hypothetical protein
VHPCAGDRLARSQRTGYSRQAEDLIEHFRTLAGGIGIGIFLTLSIAGQIKITRRSDGNPSESRTS